MAFEHYLFQFPIHLENTKFFRLENGSLQIGGWTIRTVYWVFDVIRPDNS